MNILEDIWSEMTWFLELFHKYFTVYDLNLIFDKSLVLECNLKREAQCAGISKYLCTEGEDQGKLRWEADKSKEGALQVSTPVDFCYILFN